MNDREVRFLHEWIIQTYPNTMSLKGQKWCNKQLSTDNLVNKYLGTSKVMINILLLVRRKNVALWDSHCWDKHCRMQIPIPKLNCIIFRFYPNMQHKQQHRHYHPPSAQPSDLIAYLRISYVHKSPEKNLAKRRWQAAFGCKPRQHLGFQQRRFKASM